MTLRARTARAKALPGSRWPGHGRPNWTRGAGNVGSLPLGDVARELGEVRDAQAGRLVVLLAGLAGVEDVVLIAARVAERRDGAAGTGGEGVNARVPQPGPVPKEGVDHRGRPVELR